MPPPNFLVRSATISPCEVYRYDLIRVWDYDKPRCCFVMLNPSKADGERDDPTTLKCVHLAAKWKFGSIVLVNLFAFRATDPQDLQRADFPIGPENDQFLKQHATAADMVVAAWGNHGRIYSRGPEVRDMLRTNGVVLRCLNITSSGCPQHPLYATSHRRPVTWIITR